MEVETPLYEMSGLPVFIRAGAILCRQDVTPNLEDRPPQTLYLDIYPCGLSRMDLHESAKLTNHFACEQRDGELVAVLENGCDFARCYVARLRMRPVQKVALDGRSDDVVVRSADGGWVEIEIPMPPHSIRRLSIGA